MNSTRRLIRQTMTIARRDFIATVFTPIFLLFLFAPLIMVAFSTIGAMGAAQAADHGADHVRIVAIVPDALAGSFVEADRRSRAIFRRDEEPPALVTLAPARDPAAQARAAFESRDYDATAVLYGPLDRPTLLYGARGSRAADYLAVLAGSALAAERLGGKLPRVTPTKISFSRQRATLGGQNQTAFLAVFGVFFLTLFLAGQVVGTMAEERSNKVIEVLAAAVPLEAVFLGKLLGMFGVAVLFVGFWGTVLGQVTSVLPPAFSGVVGELSPAVGLPIFAILFVSYFTMAYLLLGSVFLTIGAQATTMREIQMLSLPITIVQVGMFTLTLSGLSKPDSWLARVAEIFPLSSPFAMAGMAAASPSLWPHALALAWQALWVAIFVTLGARLFRRGVLQSGSTRPFWRRKG
ncbi:ABC-2 type transport system permease protein [Sphingomonas sp. SORGH_AS 950]|uniref:ABC transporter permease n=1 Tax=Sphingomonas sp. SORGH_AS_0950 TaxID=3041792 RepID=UPI002788793A|nr:ABC transporter permease [Sphingomonas sp. SORGH_AS_0950]MDQ1158585.1 ABC-2 type transport system permease protein [Sphingomonas sp. SORGH_AS_0950]